jgi:hypothetical protein
MVEPPVESLADKRRAAADGGKIAKHGVGPDNTAS